MDFREDHLRTAIGALGRVPRYVLEFAAREVRLGRRSREVVQISEVSASIGDRLAEALNDMEESSIRDLSHCSGLEVRDATPQGASQQLLHIDATASYEGRAYAIELK